MQALAARPPGEHRTDRGEIRMHQLVVADRTGRDELGAALLAAEGQRPAVDERK
jgi:hypothetical protein